MNRIRSGRSTSRSPSPRVRRLHWTLYALYLVVLLELAARAYWFSRGAPFFDGTRLWEAYYPELTAARASAGGDAFEVLLLGNSVLTEAFGSIPEKLSARLSRDLGGDVRLLNLAELGHCTRDSLFKYRCLEDRPVDLVVLYHGINEARANNCPDTVFRVDYSHFGWYRILNRLDAHRERAWTTLPFFLDRYLQRMHRRFHHDEYVSKGRPREDWLEYGAQVKTAGPFRNHVTEIADLAATRGETLVAGTFATYLASGYSPERFREGKLDYGKHRSPIQLWGLPEHVLAGVAVHNEIVQELAAERPGVLLCDQAALMPAGGGYFDDICHLTDEGCERFVDNLAATILAHLETGASTGGR